MPPNTGVTTSLADKLRAKAQEANIGNLPCIEWGPRFVPQWFYDSMSPLHYKLAEIGDDLEINRGQKILVVAPRGNAKSTWISMTIPLKAICKGSEKYILLIADTADQAKKYLATLKDELLNNEELRKKYPIACQEGEVWNADRIETKNGVCVEALGKGNNVRGRKYKHYRPTMIIVDDPQGDEDIISPVTRKKDIEWVDKALVPAGTKTTNIFIVGTMLHREAIVGVIANRPDFKTIIFSAIMAWPTCKDTLWKTWAELYNSKQAEKADEYYAANKAAMDHGASVLWTEKENLLELMQMRENIGHVAFSSEKMNNPRDPNKAEFKEEWFQGDDIMYDVLPKDGIVLTVGACDPAKGKETARHDYTAIITLHYHAEHHCIYVEADLEKMPIPVALERIARWHNIVDYHVFGIEAIGFQELMVAIIEDEYPFLPCVPINNHGVNKNTRISRLGIWLQRRFFRFKSNCSSTKILLSQLMDHPNADHDDGSDGLEMGMRMMSNVIGTDENGRFNADAGVDDELGDNLLR